MLKDELRLLVKERRRQYSRQQLETLSQTVVKRLAPHLRDASVVMAFYSLPDEVDTHQLIDDLPLYDLKDLPYPKIPSQFF